MTKLRVDLNCDVGESFGRYVLGNDAALMVGITSASIACGFHAGDPVVMRRTVRLALQHGVAIGAHPGLPDLVGFGRREIAVTPDEAEALTLYQIGALAAIVEAEGGQLQHVKPHGALYNMAARDRRLADAVARAVRAVSSSLVLVGRSGSCLLAAAREVGLVVASEVFADRTYDSSGQLRHRSHPDAVLTDSSQVTARVIAMVRDGRVPAAGGREVEVRADTVCVHGDTPGAPALVQALRNGLERAGIAVASLREIVQ